MRMCWQVWPGVNVAPVRFSGEARPGIARQVELLDVPWARPVQRGQQVVPEVEQGQLGELGQLELSQSRVGDTQIVKTLREPVSLSRRVKERIIQRKLVTASLRDDVVLCDPL